MFGEGHDSVRSMNSLGHVCRHQSQEPPRSPPNPGGSPSLQAPLPVGNSPDLNNVPGGNSQKRGNNKSISMSLLFPAFNFQEYFC